MIWQDIVISIGQWIFVISLVFSIVSKDKPSIWTSIITGIVLTSFSFSFITLGMMVAGISSLATATCWYILFFQSLKNRNKNE